jgi:iron complex transport system ATP-binding protein
MTLNRDRQHEDDIILRTQGLTIGYHHAGRAETVIAADLDLSLRRGELVCLLGPNGAGKSTLMRTLAGLQPALRGEIWLDGDHPADLSARELARRLSIVLTERIDVGNLSVHDLVALGRHPYTDWWGKLTPHDEEVVRWAVRAVGAGNLAERPVQELSDGERQKAMIARALAQEPLLILLDEPTAFLDLPRRVEVMGLLRTLARQTGRSILLSTHDLDLALRSADRLWLLSAEGEIQTGAPEDLVLSRAFERVFASEGIIFDGYTGSFRIIRDSAGIIHLHGDGMPALWTTRALEREGFCVDRDGTGASTAAVTITQNGDDPQWSLHINGRSHTFTEIYALIGALREKGDW